MLFLILLLTKNWENTNHEVPLYSSRTSFCGIVKFIINIHLVYYWSRKWANGNRKTWSERFGKYCVFCRLFAFLVNTAFTRRLRVWSEWEFIPPKNGIEADFVVFTYFQWFLLFALNFILQLVSHHPTYRSRGHAPTSNCLPNRFLLFILFFYLIF